MLYTVHKFTDANGNPITFADKKFTIEGSDYYLIPTEAGFTGYPNTPITYFAENCKVTLGCGLRLNHIFIGKSFEHSIFICCSEFTERLQSS